MYVLNGFILFFQVGWLKAEDQTVLTLHNRVVTHNSRITVHHDNLRTWQLRIRQLRETDRGCYMCQINTSPMKKQLGCIDVHGKYKYYVLLLMILLSMCNTMKKNFEVVNQCYIKSNDSLE